MPAPALFGLTGWNLLAAVVALALILATFAVGVVALVARVIARRWPGTYQTFGPARRRLRIVLYLVAGWIAVGLTLPDPDLRPLVNQAFLIAVIAAGAWFITALSNLLFLKAKRRFDIAATDNRVARRAQTQLTLLRRLVAVTIAVLAASAILLTFPGAQAAEASRLAPAGLVSVVAGLAAQSTLANVFAGMQLAFSDAIRLDDVVIVEGEYGRIEEITLTYVVVGVWDERRIVLPSTYFTQTPFENWTRRSAQLMGTVELDVDWRVDLDAMREELTRIVTDHPLWDGRTASIVATDARGGVVRVRPLVSARDASELWDLRCDVREKLVAWVRRAQPEALPVQRIELPGRSSEPELASTDSR